MTRPCQHIHGPCDIDYNLATCTEKTRRRAKQYSLLLMSIKTGIRLLYKKTNLFELCAVPPHFESQLNKSSFTTRARIEDIPVIISA